MANVFQMQAPCPVFAPLASLSDYAQVHFVRAAHLVEARAIAVNSAGETVLSFIDHAMLVGEWQPSGGAYPRLIHGTVVQIDAVFYVLGNPDVQVGDRCTFSNAQMEVVSTQQYGQEHCEVSLKEVGR